MSRRLRQAYEWSACVTSSQNRTRGWGSSVISDKLVRPFFQSSYSRKVCVRVLVDCLLRCACKVAGSGQLCSINLSISNTIRSLLAPSKLWFCTPRHCDNLHMPGMQKCHSLGVKRERQDESYSLLLTIHDFRVIQPNDLLFAI